MAHNPEPDDVVEVPPTDVVAEARLTPSEALEPMQLRLPARGNRKLRRLLERVNADSQLKAWWHVANVNAVLRLQINTTRGCTSRSSRTSRSGSCGCS